MKVFINCNPDADTIFVTVEGTTYQVKKVWITSNYYTNIILLPRDNKQIYLESQLIEIDEDTAYIYAFK